MDKLLNIRKEMNDIFLKVEFDRVKNKENINPDLIKEKNKIIKKYKLEKLKLEEEKNNDKCKRR